MKIRRQFKAWALVFSLCMALPPMTGYAANYPDRPITFIIASAAGGILDTIGRIIAKDMQTLGAPVVIRNVSGAGGTLGTHVVMEAPADGYTLGMVASSHAINPSLYSSLPYDTRKDFTTVSLAVKVTNVLVINPAVPAHSLQEFIVLAKSAPNKYSCGSAGNGQSNHLSLEMFKNEAGVKLAHIPYKGSAPALVDVLGGQLTCMFVDVLSAEQHIKTGKLRPLAVTSDERVNTLPNVPTFAESGMKSFQGSSWLAVVMRSGTPQDIVNKLGNSVHKTMQDPEVVKRLMAMGVVPVGELPTDSQKFMENELKRYGDIVQKSGLKID
jgi:tripartite-type tricarboxylate transporter receptor subunit TctC